MQQGTPHDILGLHAVLDRMTRSRWTWISFFAAASLAFALWLPRLTGPIDLRWDGAVYYILGTSLAQGHGYRILSEPGLPQATQYPPLLPAIVALHAHVLGTDDPRVVGPRLRLFYAAIYIAYSVLIVAFARQYFSVQLALLVSSLCILHHVTIFFSDLLFTELPFAAVSVVFAIVALQRQLSLNSGVREACSFALATAAFALRTAGVVLLVAWVIDAIARKQWKLVITRALLAFIPIAAWQGYIMHVRNSTEYHHPAYEYQRAAYQYSNVSYAENASLIDPFRPELGKLSNRAFCSRILRNVPWLVMSSAEMISATREAWPLGRLHARILGQHVTTDGEEVPIAPLAPSKSDEPSFLATYGFYILPLATLAFIIALGALMLFRNGHFGVLSIVFTTLAIVLLTPWHAQFTRYLMPLTPFLLICAVLGFLALLSVVPKLSRGRQLFARIVLLTTAFVSCALHPYVSAKLFYSHATDAAIFHGTAFGNAPRFFSHGSGWQSWEDAANWINANAALNAITATSAPHLFYLMTHRDAVLPPMEIDLARQEQLMEGVPVKYVIVDNSLTPDVSRRYVLPAVEHYNGNWCLAYSIIGAEVYDFTK